MTPSTVRTLFALIAVAALGACERHEWEDTKVLFKHGDHGGGHDAEHAEGRHGEHADSAHGEHEALPDSDHSSDPDAIGVGEEQGGAADH